MTSRDVTEAPNSLPKDNFKTFSVFRLREFLKIRGFSCQGSKEALIKQCQIYSSSPILRSSLNEQGGQSEHGHSEQLSLAKSKDFVEASWTLVEQGLVRLPKDFDIVEISNYITHNTSFQDEDEEFQVRKPLAKGRQMYCSEKLLAAFFHRTREGSILLKGKCEASMSSNVVHEPVARIKSNGTIGDAACTCKAMADGKCVHVAVLLLMAEDLVHRNEPKLFSPSTSKSQYWGQGSLKRKKPVALHVRTYSKKRKPDRYMRHEVLDKNTVTPSEAASKRIFQGLQRESMWNRILTFEYEDYECSTNRANVLVANVMEMIKNLHSDINRFSSDALNNSFCVHATGTLGQAGVPLWKEVRKWRITGSNFKRFASGNVSAVAKSVWRNEDIPDLRALQWGREHESTAREDYKRTTGETVIETGIFLSKKNPIFGFSPDGLIGDDGILEIKCPFSLREKEFEELPDLPSVKKSALPFLFDQEGVYLKHTHPYFYQVQLGLYVMEREFVDFMV